MCNICRGKKSCRRGLLLEHGRRGRKGDLAYETAGVKCGGGRRNGKNSQMGVALEAYRTLGAPGGGKRGGEVM